MADVNVLRFASKEWDEQTGFFYCARRYYDPRLQRFINHDPIQERGGLNLYAYCGNNPINRVDPLGLFPVQEGDTNPTGVNGPPDLTITVQTDPCGGKPKVTISNNDDPQTIGFTLMAVGVGTAAPAIGAAGLPTAFDLYIGIPFGTALGYELAQAVHGEEDGDAEKIGEDSNPQEGPFRSTPRVPSPYSK